MMHLKNEIHCIVGLLANKKFNAADTSGAVPFLDVFEGCCVFFIRGLAELAVPVWQSSLYSAAVPSDLPDGSQPTQRREKYVTGLFYF